MPNVDIFTDRFIDVNKKLNQPIYVFVTELMPRQYKIYISIYLKIKYESRVRPTSTLSLVI